MPVQPGAEQGSRNGATPATGSSRWNHYEVVLARELQNRGVSVARQVPIPVRYLDLAFEEGFRADMIVGGSLILEIKSTESTHPVHKKQLRTYLRLADKRLGLLLNFGLPLMRDGICRIANDLPS